MAIKRGVSLYSYQQAQFFKQMNFRDMVKEVHDNLHTDGIEIIDQSMIRKYPFPTDEFIAQFRDVMDEFNMRAVTMDIYMDVLQFRDHVMTHEEVADRLIRDIKLAARLGFENVRCLNAVPVDSIEMALPTAEEYGVRIGKEIHAPHNIVSCDGSHMGKGGTHINWSLCEEMVELADRKNTKFVGLVPDMGIFQYRCSGPRFANAVRHGANPEVLRAADRIAGLGVRDPEICEQMLKEIGTFTEQEIKSALMLVHMSLVKPQDIVNVAPYILSIHGKFYQMTEIPGTTGEYEDTSIDYWSPIYWLTKAGYNGYMNSEFEGQRDQQDRGMEFLCNEVEEVRRHHEMMDRYIARANKMING